MPPEEDAPREETGTTLRGAPVAVNPRRVAQVAAGIVLTSLAVVTVLLFVAGAHRNAQIAELHRHGVPVEVTVTGCLGQLGGSGSNAAGYTCRGAFHVGGHRYVEVIPGDQLRRPGTTVRAVTVPDDPALLTTAAAARHERQSGRVFVVPSVLAVLFVVLAATAVAFERRSRRRRARPAR